MNLTRLEAIVGSENLEKIRKLNILIIGLGGVGGYAIEALVRSGVEHITLVDGDTIKPSNINRQIIATRWNNNRYKTREWKKRIKKINKHAVVNIINAYITDDNFELLFGEQYDYIIDACDTTKVKVRLVRECHDRGIKLISSMGTANKIDATNLIVTTLDKTETDPLAKKVRHELSSDKDFMKDVVVVTSTEKAINNNNMLGSTAFVPGVAGLLIANYIIKDVIK